MSKPLPDFVSDETPSTPAVEQAAPPAETAPVQAEAAATPPAEAETKGPARAPDGKFAPAQPAPEAAVAPAPVEAPPVTPAPPAPEVPPPVPLATFLDLRDRAAAAEKRAKELEEWRAQQEAQARRQPVPTFDENPAAAVAHQQQQIQAAIFETRRDFSRQVAEMRHGKENVDAAYSWAESLIDQQLRQTGRSALNDDLVRHPDPVAFVVDQWRREQIASKVDPKKFEAYLAWEAAQAAAEQAPALTHQPAAAPPPPAQPAVPRPSLAAAPSAANSGAPIVRDGAGTFDALFGT